MEEVRLTADERKALLLRKIAELSQELCDAVEDYQHVLGGYVAPHVHDMWYACDALGSWASEGAQYFGPTPRKE